MVSVKIVEFQTSGASETGLSAYFAQRNQERAWGRVSSGNGNIRSADITFPNQTGNSITVFLDQIELNHGDIEILLQGLVDQNRAFILSQPKGMVTVGTNVPTKILTTQNIGYENPVAVGSTITQVTSFRETGVSLEVCADEIADDDQNLRTLEDTYIRLRVVAAVNEEGQRITIGLAVQNNNNAIKVPEFVSRSVGTSVWVRHGQVLLLGGLYRNTKNTNLSTLPWLTQGEDVAMGLAQRLIPPARVLGSPLSSTLGNRRSSEGRRELVFLLKAELASSTSVASGFSGAVEVEEPKKKPSLSNMIQDISEIPEGIVHGISGTEPAGIDSSLGGDR